MTSAGEQRETLVSPLRREAFAAKATGTTFDVGRSVSGLPITATSFGVGDDCVLLIATIHGNEAAGTPLILRLMERLREDAEITRGRRVVVVPVANPDGMAAGTRFNARGVDLNRNFPANNFGPGGKRGATPLSEPESRALHQLIEQINPSRVVSIHQPLACIDYDGPGEALARIMGASSRLPVKKLGGRPGSLGSWVSERGCPIITVELPRGVPTDEQKHWDRFGPMLELAITTP